MGVLTMTEYINREAIRDALIAEEIADGQIMLEQMMLLHDCEDAVIYFRRRKIKRLAERLKEANHEKDIT